jgi:hypothetical protein
LSLLLLPVQLSRSCLARAKLCMVAHLFVFSCSYVLVDVIWLRPATPCVESGSCSSRQAHKPVILWKLQLILWKLQLCVLALIRMVLKCMWRSPCASPYDELVRAVARGSSDNVTVIIVNLSGASR